MQSFRKGMIFYDIFFLISAENYFLYLKRKFTTASLTWEMSFTMVFVTVPYRSLYVAEC